MEGREEPQLAPAPMIMFVLDRNGTFLASEGRGLAVLGLKPGQVVGQRVQDVYRFDPTVIDQAMRAMAGEEIESTAEVPPGSGIFWQTHLTPRRDATGSIDGAMGVVYNVSERVRSAARVRLLEERLR